MRPDRDERGFSLLELVAVLAIYSVLAILTVQLLSNAAISRTQISESVVSVTEAAAAAAVLRRDLEHLSPASGAQPPRFGDATAVFRTSDGIRAEAVEWRLDGGTLLRITEAGRQPMLMGVTRFDLRVLGPSGVWMPGSAFAQTAPGDLPKGLEAVIDLASLGPIRVVVAR